ncbi:MAG TPA: hypothetical protein VF814_20225 [Casimicrobiaceae bacterium]
MKMHTLLFTALAAFSATAAAAGPASDPRPLRLAEMVAHMESNYGGEVTAIQFDASGDKRPHYHVDLWYPQFGLVRYDVDAVSRGISAHDTGDLPPGSATLSEVTTLVATQLPGQLTVAELDTGDGASPHYDVDVRVAGGKIARLKVDAATRSIGWRQPAVVDE